MGIIFAILSLSFAGVNDLVFKKYGQERRPVGLFLACVGVIWTVFFLFLGVARQTLHLDSATLVIGSIAGLFSALANILLIEAMKRTGASVASTIYRLNLVFVGLLAFLFLHEAMTFWKIAGLATAVLAVVFFSLPSKEHDSRHKLAGKFILVLLVASFMRACMGISYKVASSLGASDELFLAINGVWWSLAGLAYYAIREKDAPMTVTVARYALLSGLLICGIVLFLKLAVNHADASVAVTISQFSFLVTAPLSVVLMKERFTVHKTTGLTLAAVCITFFYLAR